MRRYCCPRHGARPDQWDDLSTDGDYYLIPLATGWTLAVVRRTTDQFESQEFPTQTQAAAWAEGKQQTTLF